MRSMRVQIFAFLGVLLAVMLLQLVVVQPLQVDILFRLVVMLQEVIVSPVAVQMYFRRICLSMFMLLII